MKVQVTAQDFSTLDAQSKARCTQNADGSYTMDLSGVYMLDQDPGALLRSKNHEKEARQQAEAKLKEYEEKKQAEIDAAAKEAAEKARADALAGGDLSTIVTQLEGQLSAQQQAFDAAIAQRDQQNEERENQTRNFIMKTQIDSLVGNLPLTDGSQDYMRFELQQQLEFAEDGRTVVVKGSPETSITDFQKNLLDNEKYAGIMVASKGSGVSDSQTLGTKIDTAGKKFDDFDPEQLSALRKQDPAKYESLKASRQEPEVEPLLIPGQQF